MYSPLNCPDSESKYRDETEIQGEGRKKERKRKKKLNVRSIGDDKRERSKKQLQPIKQTQL